MNFKSQLCAYPKNVKFNRLKELTNFDSNFLCPIDFIENN